MVVTLVVLTLAGVAMMVNAFTSPFFILVALVVGGFGAAAIRAGKSDGEPAWHRIVEGRALIFTVLATLAVLAGGIAELVPALVVRPAEAAVA